MTTTVLAPYDEPMADNKLISPIESDISGQCAIVSGAASGIGAAVAAALRKQGVTVYDCDRHGATHTVDVTQDRDWSQLVERVVGEHAQVDILVNNAGIAAPTALAELTDAEWNSAIEVNAAGTMRGMRAVLPSMLTKGAGSIVNVGSIIGHSAIPASAAYQASKAAVAQLTKSAAASYSSRGVRVNCVLPGFIHTPMTEGQDDVVNRAFIHRTPMQRAGTPEEVAEVIVFLASARASFVTGVALPVDGGYLA